ncbi:hypothetical protein L083_3306 [Actinoplanes sp. N902-109]|nr:hypothetical protein L083_3306 [Actinoplanes sp. N902-109]
MALGVVVAGLTTAAPAAAAATNWRMLPVPPLKPANALLDISATGPGDVWAAGYQDDSYGRISPHPYALLHWNGTSWAEQTLPGERISLAAVSAAAPADVWTVGQDKDLAAYVAHWDGTAWRDYRLPGSSGTRAVLTDVDSRGGRTLLAGGNGHALLVEPDAGGFTPVPVPGADAWAGDLYGVTTAPDGSAFAVGSWFVDNAGYPEPLVVQNTGGSWRVAALPRIPAARLLDVWARSATDAWAVGSATYDSNPEPVLLHWDGRTWQRVSTGLSTGTLSAVAGDASGTVWVSAYDYPASKFLRYQRGKWTTVTGPAAPYLSALTAVPGTSSFWAVGLDTTPGGDIAAVIERTGS